MKEIFNKYINLNKTNMVFGLLSACFFGLIAFDSNKYYPVALLMAPSLLFSFVVGKMCYEEDSKSTKEFLLSLPIVKNKIALEKNIVGQICIFIGFIIVHLMFFYVNVILKNTEMIFNIEMIFLVASFLIVYNTVYIFLNYKFDYSKTQFTSYIIVVLGLALFKFGNDSMALVNNLNSYILVAVLIILSCTSLFITKNIKWES
ncbi:MAG: hypothetical protein JG770_1523 [Mahella sp.]|nr:hypothetical protein [Mahella sp.]